MTAVAVCTDSSSLLPPAAAAALGVDVVPIGLALDGVPYDEAALSFDELYDRLEDGARATTSQPSAGAFAEAYDRAHTRGAGEVLSVHLDARVSGTCSAASLGAETAPVPVRVVDCGTVSYGVAVCVREVAKALASGAPTDEAADVATSLGARMRNAFVAHPVTPGRVPADDRWTVLRYEHGSVEPIARCETASAAVAEMARLPLTESAQVSVAVGHAARAMETAADDLAHRLVDASQVRTVERYRVGAAVAAHTGPASFGLFWWFAP
jgi:fatty acid-binding protein DegV